MLSKQVNSLIKVIKILFIIFSYSFVMHMFSRNYLAEKYNFEAQRLLDNYQLPLALARADEAIKLNPLEPNYYRIRARVYINYLLQEKGETKVFLKKVILNDLATAYVINPYNLVTMRNIVPLYYFVAAKDISAPASATNVDPEFVDDARKYFAQIKNYSPTDVGVYALLAKYEKRLNLTKEYDESVAVVRKLRPDLLDWYDSFR